MRDNAQSIRVLTPSSGPSTPSTVTSSTGPVCAITIISLLIGLLTAPPAFAQSGDTGVASDPASRPADAGQTESTDAQTGPDVPPPKTTSTEALLEQADEIAGRVASIRGLPLKRKVARGIKNREQLRKSLIDQFERAYGKQQLVDEGDVLRRLGLISDSLDWYQTLIDLMTDQVAGFYDQRTDELFIMRGLPAAMQRPAMAHELYHAVQDQHFGLERILDAPDRLNADDAALAARALIEGDAVVTMIDFVMYDRGRLPSDKAKSVADLPMYANMLTSLPDQGLGAIEKMVPESERPAGVSDISGSQLARAPRILREILLFPYLWGMRWVIQLKQGRPWSQFNRVYRHPPISTEQILHPEAYAEGDDPEHLTYRASEVLGDYERIYNTTLGEFQMRLLLQTHLPTDTSSFPQDELPTAAEAAAGWDGDRLYGFRHDNGDIAVTHVSVWDSPAEAKEYYRALNAATRHRYPGASLRRASGPHGESFCARRGDQTIGERVYLERWGDAVMYAEGIPSEYDQQQHETNPALYRLREFIWETLDREPLRPLLEKAYQREEDDTSTDSAAANTDSDAREPSAGTDAGE